MEGIQFKHWKEEVYRYLNYRFTFELCDTLGIVIIGQKLDCYEFRWEKYYQWEDIRAYNLHEILNKFVAEYNFKYEEYRRFIDNAKE